MTQLVMLIIMSLVLSSCKLSKHYYAQDSEEYAEIRMIELSENSSVFSALLDTLLHDTISKKGINNSELFYFNICNNKGIENDTIFDCSRVKYDDIPVVYQILSDYHSVLYYKGYMFLLYRIPKTKWFIATDNIAKIYTSHTNILKPKYYKIPIVHKTYIRRDNVFFCIENRSFIDKCGKYKYYSKKRKARKIQYCG
ncbi:MAG: hypothetical protein ACTTJH_08170 [Bacteroidales bacterium]